MPGKPPNMCHAAKNLDPTFDNLTLKMTFFSQYAINIVAIALLSAILFITISM